MSKILRRPMFRGGKVDSYGTGIATGLGTRSGYYRGGGVSYNPFNQAQTSNLLGRNAPRVLPDLSQFGESKISSIFNPVKITPTGFQQSSPMPGSNEYTMMMKDLYPGSDYGEPLSKEDIEESLKQGGIFENYTFEEGFREGKDMDLEPSSRIEQGLFGTGVFDGSDTFRERKGKPKFYNRDEPASASPELEAIRQQNIADLENIENIENIDKMDNSPKEVKTPKPGDDEPEVTMTDLEKALGLDKARQEYAADALAAASAAFFEGKGFGAIADAAKVKSKAPDIKRLAGLEEFKAKKQQELFDKKTKRDAEMKAGTKGSVQKTVDFLVSQGMDKDEAIKRATKQSGTFAEELSKNSVGGTILSQGFALAAETFYGDSYKGDVTAVEVINADKSTSLPDGIYSDKDNKLIFEVKDKKVVFDRSYS